MTVLEKIDGAVLVVDHDLSGRCGACGVLGESNGGELSGVAAEF